MSSYKSLTIGNGGYKYSLDIYGGDSATNITISQYGYVQVDGGTATNITIKKDGYLYVNKGTVNKVTVGAGSTMLVNKQGKASNITVNKGGQLEINDGNALTITVRKGGIVNGFIWTKDMKFKNFSKVSGLRVASGKEAWVSGKNSISNVTVAGKKTTLYVECGGTASNVTVGKGAELMFCFGGKATNITVKKGGIINGVTFKSDTKYSNSAVFLNKKFGDNTDDTWKAASQKKTILSGKTISGWVGLKDAKDFIKIKIQKEGSLSLTLDSLARHAYQDGKLKLSLLMYSGSSGNVKTIKLARTKKGDGFVSRNVVFAKNTTCYLGISCSDKNYYTSYNIKTGVLAS